MSTFTSIGVVLRYKYYLIYIYAIMSVMLTLILIVRGDAWHTLCLVGTSFLSLIAAGGLKFGILWSDRAQRVGVPVVALMLLTLAYWLSSGFSVQLFGYQLSGFAWGLIGTMVGGLCIDRPMTLKKDAGSESPVRDNDDPLLSLAQRSSSTSSDRSCAFADMADRQLTFDKSGEVIIRPGDLHSVIARYADSAKLILDISEEEAIRRAEHGDGFALASLIRTLKDTRTSPEASCYAKFHTDEDGEIDSIHHGWCFDSFAIIDGLEVTLLQAMRFADTMDGVLSAFFASVILPTIGAYWHGLYERDYQLIESPEELNEVMFGDNLEEATGHTQAILKTPLGLRIQKINGNKLCKCLCHSETEGLLDIEFIVSADGRAYEAVRTVLREPEGRTFY